MKGRPSDEGHLLTAGTIDSANFACTVRRSSLPARKKVQKDVRLLEIHRVFVLMRARMRSCVRREKGRAVVRR